MSVTRKLLKGMGLTEEQADTIIEAHTDTVEKLKQDTDVNTTMGIYAHEIEEAKRNASECIAETILGKKHA